MARKRIAVGRTAHEEELYYVSGGFIVQNGERMQVFVLAASIITSLGLKAGGVDIFKDGNGCLVICAKNKKPYDCSIVFSAGAWRHVSDLHAV